MLVGEAHVEHDARVVEGVVEAAERRSTVVSTIASTCSGSAMSVWMKTASPPPSRILLTTRSPSAARLADMATLAPSRAKQERRRLADAGVSAGDQGHLAVELSAHKLASLASS